MHPTTSLARRVADLDSDALQDALQARIRDTATRALAHLARQARLHPGATPPQLELPPVLLEMLAAALALEAAQGLPDGPRAEALWQAWTVSMPQLLIEHLASSDAAAVALFHTDLEPQRLPRITAARAALARALADAGVDPQACLPAPPGCAPEGQHTLAALYPQTHFGRCMPMLYCYPHDLASYARTLAAGTPALALLDERLAAPLVHELSHLHRARRPLWPPALEESVAGWLGAHAMPSLVWPLPGHDHALFGAHWFAQVGQALCHAFGERSVWRAHAGVEPWGEALPGGLVERLERLGWAQHVRLRAAHLLGETTRPMPWIKAFFAAASGALDDTEPTLDALDALPLEALAVGGPGPRDAEVVACALRTAWNVTRQRPGGVWRVHAQAPTEPVVLDWQHGLMRAPARGDDPAAPTWWLPPALCLAWRAHAVARHVVTFEPCSDATRDATCDALASVLAEPSRWTGTRRLEGATLE